eukprot:gene25718-34293_t
MANIVMPIRNAALETKKCVVEGDICVNDKECCHVGSSCTLNYTMDDSDNNTKTTIKRCRRSFSSRCVYPSSRAAFFQGVDSRIIPTTLETFQTISIRINGLLGGCFPFTGNNDLQNRLTILYAFAQLSSIHSSKVAYSSCQEESDEIVVHFQSDKNVALRDIGDMEEATKKLRGIAKLFQTLSFFYATVTAVSKRESATPRLLQGLPSNSLICQFGGFCRKDSDCTLGNSCVFASNAYSQCLPNYSVYKTIGCVMNYSPSCDDSTVCCDPGAYCSSGPYRQCIQPNVPDCILPTSYNPIPLPTQIPSAVSTALPTVTPTTRPTSKFPSPLVTRIPTYKASIPPTEYPSMAPINNPSEVPSANPTILPSPRSTRVPSKSPSRFPSIRPSIVVTNIPTRQPSRIPSILRTLQPSLCPSNSPSTYSPSEEPSVEPTVLLTENPTAIPTSSPTAIPSKRPSYKPSICPSTVPTVIPTAFPSRIPTKSPTRRPTCSPTRSPTQNPTIAPSEEPTIEPTVYPSEIPTAIPSTVPSKNPSKRPSRKPSNLPTMRPTVIPTVSPSKIPTKSPTRKPTTAPSCSRTQNPTIAPSEEPTIEPTVYPSEIPTTVPSTVPSKNPSKRPSRKPSNRPTMRPTVLPTAFPSRIPTKSPTRRPTTAPSCSRTQNPTITPSEEPTSEPTMYPSEIPTTVPSTVTSRIPLKAPTRKPQKLRPTVSLTNNPSITPIVVALDSPTTDPSRFSCIPIGIPTKYSSSTPSTKDNPTTSFKDNSTTNPSLSSIASRSDAPNPGPVRIPSSVSSNATLTFRSLLILANFSTDVKSLDFNARKAVTDTYNIVLGLSQNSTLYDLDKLDQTTIATHKAVVQVEDIGDNQPNIYIYLRVVTLLSNYPKHLHDPVNLYQAMHSNLTSSFQSGNFLDVLRNQFHIQNEPSFYYVTVVNISDVFEQLYSISSAPSVAPFGILHQTSQIYSEMIIMTSSALIISAFILAAIIVYKIARATAVEPPQQTLSPDNSSIAPSEADTCQGSDVCNSKVEGPSACSTLASAMLSISDQDEMKRSSMHSLDPPSSDNYSTDDDPFNRKTRFRESSSVHGNSIYFQSSSLTSRISDEDVGYNFDNHQVVLDFGKLRSAISAEPFGAIPSDSDSDITVSDSASETVMKNRALSSSLSSSSVYSATMGRSPTIDVGNVYSMDSHIG